MRIQHNIMALNSHRQLGINNSNIAKSLEKLSSGYRINRAGDDAAGLAISEKMRAQIKGLEAATDNSQDAISLVQTAEGGLQEVHSMLNRMQELATKSSNGTYTDDVDRQALQDEVSALKDEINRIADSTNFNGINLLDGTLSNSNTVDIQFSTTKLTMGSGFDFTGSISMEGDDSKTGGVSVTLTGNDTPATTKLEITVGTKAGSSVTTAEIEKAVRAEAERQIATGNLSAAQKTQFESLLSFTVSGSDMNFASDTAVVATTAVNMGVKIDPSTNVAYQSKDDAPGTLVLQIGDTNDGFNQLAVSIADMHTAGLDIAGIDISTREGASDAIKKIKTAINTVSTQRGKLGAIQNRLEHTINNLGVTTENITAAESRIRDVDMAKEMMEFTKNSVLMQSAQAMLAQANMQPQSVLQLLQ